MTPEALAAELRDDPAEVGYAGLDGDVGALVQRLNDRELGLTMPRTTWATARTVLAECSQGGLALDAMEVFAKSEPADQESEAIPLLRAATKWAMRFLEAGQGIDVGHSRTRTMIDALIAAGKLTQTQGDEIKAIAVKPASRFEVLSGKPNAHATARLVTEALAVPSPEPEPQ